MKEYDEWSLYPYGYGYSIYTVKNLPAGIKYKEADDGESARLYGTPTKVGSYNTTVSCKDELGNIKNYTVKFIIGSSSSIAAASYTRYLVTGAGGVVNIDFDRSEILSVTGGSGSYKYAIYGADYELTMSENGYLSGTLRGAGTYNLKVKITDADNSKLSTTATVTIKVVQGLTVAGIVKDANGNPIPYADITFTNKDKSSQYVTSKYSSTNSTGAYSVYLPSGTYDVRASYDDTVIYLYNQKITGSKSGYDLSLPLYKVSIYSNNKNISSSDFGTWYDSTHKSVGSGNALYLKAGTYKLSTNEKTSGFYTYKASLTITVKKSMIATAAVTVTGNRVKGSVGANSNATLNLTSDYVYYKFTPQTSGTYYFYTESTSDTYGVLCGADGSEISSNDDGGDSNNFELSNYCTAGTTYYIGVRAYNSDYVGNSCTLKVSTTAP